MEENKQIVNDTEVKVSEEKKTGKKGNKKLIIGIVLAIVALFLGFILIIGIILAVLFWPKKVNLNDYVTVEFVGYDTMGTAVVKIDEEAFLEDYEGKLKFRNEAYKDGTSNIYAIIGSGACGAFISNISLELDQYENLSNGQEVVVTLNYDEENYKTHFNYGITFEEATFVVEGLQEIQTFDPFENIEVSFYGKAPNGMVQISVLDSSSVYSGLYYEATEIAGLENGDVITINLKSLGDPIDYCISNYGICPTITEKDYTVEGLDRCVNSLNEITTDGLNAMIAQGQDVFNSYVANNWDRENTVDQFLYQGSYLLTPKPGMENGNESIFYIVYKVNATWKFESIMWRNTYTVPVEFYYVVEFDVPYIDGDGNCVVDTTSYKVPDMNYLHTYTPDGSRYDETLKSRGFMSLESVFTYCVQSRIESYSYETNIAN